MIVDEIAELLYTSDTCAIPWDKALEEDRILYTRTAEVLIDAVSQFLDRESANYSGSLNLASEVLATQAEFSRLRRAREVAV